MIKFPSIESFKSEYFLIRRYCENNNIAYPTISYSGTVKLHGSNAGVHLLPDGTMVAQSHTRELFIGDDNYGWAANIDKNQEVIKTFIRKYFGINNDICIFGELIGKGIQKNMAINNIIPKQFVIFAIKVNDVWINNDVHYKLPEYNIRNILEVPEYHVDVSFSDPTEALEKINALTLEVEQECPWGHMHGFDGLGEGIVWEYNKEFRSTFKTKGVKHKGGKGATIKTPRIDENDYVELMTYILPEWRLTQGIQFLIENNMEVLPQNIGQYLKFINNDIRKEEMDILEKFDKPWKVVVKYVGAIAKEHFFAVYHKLL